MRGNFAWKDFWVHIRQAICKMYEPRIEISAFDNKLLVRCTYAPVPGHLVPRVGVGVRVDGASGGGVVDVAPECLLDYSDGSDEGEGAKTALPHVDLWFDFAQIIHLHKLPCDTRGPSPRYPLHISAGVLHTYDAYTRFSKTEGESFFVACDHDPGESDPLPKVKEVGQGLTGLVGYALFPPPPPPLMF